MLFFRKKPAADDNSAPASSIPPVQLIRSSAPQLSQALPAQPDPRIRLVLGYISPNADMDAVSRSVRERYPKASVLLTSTAGELCAQRSSDALYQDTPQGWQGVVLQLFSDALIEQVHIANVRWAVRTSARARPSSSTMPAWRNWRTRWASCVCHLACAPKKVLC